MAPRRDTTLQAVTFAAAFDELDRILNQGLAPNGSADDDFGPYNALIGEVRLSYRSALASQQALVAAGVSTTPPAEQATLEARQMYATYSGWAYTHQPEVAPLIERVLHTQPVLDAAGYACCPSHPTRRLKARPDGQGWRCTARAEHGWCGWSWAGAGYTPPDQQGASVSDPSSIGDRTRIELGSNSALGRGTTIELGSNYAVRGRLISSAELADLPPIEWLVTDMIPACDLVTLYGASGAGKSFALVDLAATVAQVGTVIYVAAEALATYAERIAAWRERHQRSANGLLWWTDAVNLLDQDAIDGFLTSIRPHTPKLIIFDTLARCLVGGDENSALDMGRAIAAADHIRRETGATIVFCHHTTKSGSTERGSSALRGACGTMIELSNDDGLLAIKCDKQRRAAPFEPRYFRLTGAAGSAVLTPTSKVASRYLPVSARQLQVLEVLDRSYHNGEATFTQLADVTEMSKGSLSASLSRLLDRGYIRKESAGRGVKVTLTETGRDYLRDQELTNRAENEFDPPIELELNWPVSSSIESPYTENDRTSEQDASNDDRVRSSSIRVRSEFDPPVRVRSVFRSLERNRSNWDELEPDSTEPPGDDIQVEQVEPPPDAKGLIARLQARQQQNLSEEQPHE